MKLCRLAPALLLGLALAALLAPVPLRAQGGEPTIVVIHTATTPQGDGLALQVYFALRDAGGNPVLKDAVRVEQEGQLQLIGTSADPATASVGLAEAQIKVLLLMDASGSMRPIIDEVRAAAQQAVKVAPENALLAVAQFAQLDVTDPLEMVEPFTPNRTLLSQAVAAIDPQPRAPTCLYNAAYRAIETLKEAGETPQERLALIVFTDGKDDNGAQQPCSTRTVENVIAGAKERGLPLYTIGLCENAACENLERPILRQMADETGGVSATGEIEQLDELFKLIMDGLSSQWVAEAVLYPRQGTNTAALSVLLGADGPQVDQTFRFVSDADYNAPASFQLTPAYVQEHNTYELGVTVSNPAVLEELTLEVWGNGVVLSTQRLSPDNLAEPVKVSTAGMNAGEEYCFQIKAIGRDRVPVKSAEGKPVLAEQCVQYEPRLDFTITSADPDWENNKLLIGVDVRGAPSEAQLFEGRITSEGGQTIATFQRVAPNAAGNLVIDLPSAFRQADPETPFQIALTLLNGANGISRQYEAAITPPKGGFPLVPALGAGVGLLLAIGLAVFMLNARGGRGGGKSIPKPAALFNDPTRELGAPVVPPTPARPAARVAQVPLTVIQTTAPGQQGQSVMIAQDSSPFVIGRSEAARLTINDREMSKNHAQLAVAGRDLFITDLNSLNGTYVNGQRLKGNDRQPLTLPAEVRLGHNTVVRLEQA